MDDPKSLYVDGAKVGSILGAFAGRLREIVVNVTDYANGIVDAATVASKPAKGADDGVRRADD